MLGPVRPHDDLDLRHEPGPAQQPAVRMAKRLLRWAGTAVVLAVLLRVADPYIQAWSLERTVPLIRIIGTFLKTSASFLATVVLVVAAAIVAAALPVTLWAWMQWRRSRVREAIARRLSLPPDRVRVRVRWQRSHPWLPRKVRVRYPAAYVVQDPTDDLVDLFAVNFRTLVAVDYAPHRDWIRIERLTTPRETELEEPPPRIEETNALVGGIHTTLEPLLAGLTVDQQQTVQDTDGAVRRIVLRYDRTTKDVNVKFRARVASVIEQKVISPTGAWSARWYPSDHRVVIDPAEPIPESVENRGLPAGWRDHLALPLGLGNGSRVLSWKPLVHPHMLIAGVTGGGKTSLMRTILVMASLLGWRIWLIDPKETGFWHFRDWPGVERVCLTGEEMRQALFDHRDEMNRVYSEVRHGRLRFVDVVPVLLIFDEMAEGLADIAEYVDEVFPEWKEEDSSANKPAELKKGPAAAWRVTRKGRQAHFWQVIGIQRPDVSFIPGEARDNLTSRMAAGTLNRDGLEMVFDTADVKQRTTKRQPDPATGEHRDIPIRGRVTVDLGDGPEPMQPFFTPDPAPGEHTPDQAQLLQWLYDGALQALQVRLRHEQQVAQRTQTPEAHPAGYVPHVAGTPRNPGPAGASPPPDVPDRPATALAPLPDPTRTSPPAPSADTAADPPAVREDGGGQVIDHVPARDLQPGQWILVDVDGTEFLAEVVSVGEEGPEEFVDVDYCTVDGAISGFEIDGGEHIPRVTPPEQSHDADERPT